MNMRVTTIPEDVIKELHDAITNYENRRSGPGTLDELREAHGILAHALNQMVERRNQAIHAAIPDELFNVELADFMDLSVTVELDAEVEEMIDKALRLSERHIEWLTSGGSRTSSREPNRA